MRTTKAQISLRISAFVVPCLDSIIPLVSISAISRLQLVLVAAQAGLSLVANHQDMFSRDVAQVCLDSWRQGIVNKV